MVTVATCQDSKPMQDVASIIKEFRTVYADAVVECLTEAEWQKAAKIRQLRWKADHRIPLQDAAVCYAQIVDGYNEFQPHMIADLHVAFDGCGIEVTPAREFSVGIHLHVPDKPGLRTRVERFVRKHFEADLVSWEDSETLHVWWD